MVGTCTTCWTDLWHLDVLCCESMRDVKDMGQQMVDRSLEGNWLKECQEYTYRYWGRDRCWPAWDWPLVSDVDDDDDDEQPLHHSDRQLLLSPKDD